MLMRRGEHKVRGGKLIRVLLEEDRGRIARIRITGDFFLHPEDAIFELERALEGVELKEGPLLERIKEVYRSAGAFSIGAGPEDFVKAILGAKAWSPAMSGPP
ncbi:MAG: lipoate protein ligase C-terminal domain-containing protein [Candidatus Bathyarchaeia archaeon]